MPALPLRGPIDIVGAGDAVTASLAVSLAVEATPRETIEVASLAASVVIHQLGTTGAASSQAIAALLESTCEVAPQQARGSLTGFESCLIFFRIVKRGSNSSPNRRAA